MIGEALAFLAGVAVGYFFPAPLRSVVDWIKARARSTPPPS